MTLNHREYAEFHKGMTIQDVITERRFTWPKIVVLLNGKVIRPEDYEGTVIDSSDSLEVIHLLAGG